MNKDLDNGFYLGDWLVLPKQNILSAFEKEIYIEPKLMDVLVCLSSETPEVLSADRLIEICWPNQFFSDNPVHKCIARLRKVLGDDARKPTYIKTIPKKGYVIISQVSVVEPSKQGVVHYWDDGPPYLGFESYKEIHEHVFFGRHKATTEVKELIKTFNTNLHVLIIMGGQSVGKSSLIDSKIIPFLKIPANRLGNHLDSFLKFTVSNDIDINETTLLKQQLKIESGFECTKDSSTDENTRPKHLLFVDQLERLLISKSPVQIQLFINFLNELIECNEVLLIIALNHEYFAEIMAYKPFQNIKKKAVTYDLLPPDQEELREIIRKPVKASRLKFEYDEAKYKSLDLQIINDIKNIDLALPILSYTMRELCVNKNSHNELTFSSYFKMGRVTGFIAKQFDEIYKSSTVKERFDFKQILHHLIKIDQRNTNKLYCSEIELKKILNDSTERILTELMSVNLISTKVIKGKTYASIVHESLLEKCEFFEKWAIDNKYKLANIAKIQALHAHWLKDNKSNQYLSNDLVLLKKSEQFNLNDSERGFVVESIKKLNKTKQLKIGGVVSLIALLLITTVSLFQLHSNNQKLLITKHKAEALNHFLITDLKEELIPIGRLDLLAMISEQIIQYYNLQSENDFTVSANNHIINALNTKAEMKIRSGKLEDAMKVLFSSDAYIQKNLKLDKDDIQTLFQSSQNNYWHGYIYYLNKEWSKTKIYWTKYLQLTSELEQLEPENLKWKLEHSYALNNLGTISLNLKNNELAQNYLNQSKQIKAALVEKEPNNSQYVAELADTVSWIANTLDKDNKLEEANSYFLKSLNLSQKLLQIDPQNSNWNYRLALAYYRLAKSDYDLGDLQGVHSNVKHSVSILNDLMLIDEKNQSWIRTLINSHILLAKYHRQNNFLDQALWHVEQGKFYYHKYSAENKKLTREANQLLKLNTISSLIMNHLGQKKAALSTYKQAYEQFQSNSDAEHVGVFTVAFHFFNLYLLSDRSENPEKPSAFIKKAQSLLKQEIENETQNRNIKALYLVLNEPNDSSERLKKLKNEIDQMRFRNPDLFKQENINE